MKYADNKKLPCLRTVDFSLATASAPSISFLQRWISSSYIFTACFNLAFPTSLVEGSSISFFHSSIFYIHIRIPHTTL